MPPRPVAAPAADRHAVPASSPLSRTTALTIGALQDAICCCGLLSMRWGRGDSAHHCAAGKCFNMVWGKTNPSQLAYRSIWDAKSEAGVEEGSALAEQAPVAAPQTPSGVRPALAAAPAVAPAAAVRPGPVTAQPVATPPAQQTSMADQVRTCGWGCACEGQLDGQLLSAQMRAPPPCWQ